MSASKKIDNKLSPKKVSMGKTKAAESSKRSSQVSRDYTPNNPSDDSDMFLLDAEPSKEYSSSVLRFSTSKTILEGTSSTPGGRKRSFRKISVENSPLIPLNDDCNELIEEQEKTEVEQEKSAVLNKSSSKAEEEQDISIMNTMTMEQMQEHVSRCLQLCTENKINSKNAFALKLIDCMTIISKNDEKSNFAAMACQLDAGAKIYSHRVDAVHQQVMRLVETCMFAEKRTKKAKGANEQDSDASNDEENEEGTSDDKLKGKKKKKQKKVIATADQITRKPKETDPREQFVRLEALPGDILLKAKRNPKDLSLTLDKHTPFWRNSQDESPTKATGDCEIPDIVIKNRRVGPRLKVDRELDISSIPKLEPMLTDQHEGDDDIYDDPMGDLGDEDDFEISKESRSDSTKHEELAKSDAEIVCQGMARMTNEGTSKPSRLDVMKALFHQPEESDYHYLKMDNSYYWAGPSYWKRPQGINHEANKKKIIRKKKEPSAIEYTEEAGKMSLKPKAPKRSVAGLSLKRSTKLSKRTISRWAKKKITYPIDIHFKPQTFFMVFHVDIVAEVVIDQPEDVPNAQSTTGGEPEEDNGEPAEADSLAEDLECMDLNNADTADSSGSDAEDKPAGDPGADKEEKPEEEQKDLAVPSTSGGCAGPSSSCDVYEGDNLVPMVKTVKVDPIRYVAKPNRVDMQHLKQVMLEIILRAIEDRENQLQREGVNSPRGSVPFKDVLTELFSSDDLHYRTREDLTVQMSFLCLLTLANENAFDLTKDDTDDIVISFADGPNQGAPESQISNPPTETHEPEK